MYASQIRGANGITSLLTLQLKIKEYAIKIDLLPPQYRAPAQALLSKTLVIYPRTVALAAIGSVADGTWLPDSDLDVVWIHRGRRKQSWHERIAYDYESRVELVAFNLKQVHEHFRQHSPMAHALQSGLMLYDPEGLHAAWRETPLGLPTRHYVDMTYAFMSRRLEWGMDSYRRECRFHRRFCKQSSDCYCSVSDVLCRAVWNLVRLVLVVQGYVPMSSPLALSSTATSELTSTLSASKSSEMATCRISSCLKYSTCGLVIRRSLAYARKLDLRLIRPTKEVRRIRIRVSTPNQAREPIWTESLATGDRNFVEATTNKYRARSRFTYDSIDTPSGQTWAVRETPTPIPIDASCR